MIGPCELALFDLGIDNRRILQFGIGRTQQRAAPAGQSDTALDFWTDNQCNGAAFLCLDLAQGPGAFPRAWPWLDLGQARDRPGSLLLRTVAVQAGLDLLPVKRLPLLELGNQSADLDAMAVDDVLRT